MKSDRWVKQWAVPSESGPGDYIVSLDIDGNYACGCPGWTRNVKKFCSVCNNELNRKDNWCWRCRKVMEPGRTERIECKHIREVKEGRGRTLAERVLDRMVGR